MPLLEQIGVSNNIDGVVMLNAKTKAVIWMTPFFVLAAQSPKQKCNDTT